jgi:hypothetical protein
MKKLLLLFLSALFMKSISAATVPADSSYCSSAEAHQFDFWIGNWDIEQKIIQKDGTWLKTIARDSVFSILKGCAIEEHWNGNVKFFWAGMKKTKPMEGFSIRYYDANDKKWHIKWMDNFNPTIGDGFAGNFKDGIGEFFQEKNIEKGKRLSRITFSDITKNSFHWDLSISSDIGKTWSKIWIMEMKRI